MNWWQLLILWLGGWLAIIVLNIFNRAIKEQYIVTENIESELVADANNLFACGLFYFIGNLLCNFIDLPVLHWILFIVGVAACVLPVLSLLKFFIGLFRMMPNYIISFIGAVISQCIPLIMALNIYFTHLR